MTTDNLKTVKNTKRSRKLVCFHTRNYWTSKIFKSWQLIISKQPNHPTFTLLSTEMHLIKNKNKAFILINLHYPSIALGCPSNISNTFPAEIEALLRFASRKSTDGSKGKGFLWIPKCLTRRLSSNIICKEIVASNIRRHFNWKHKCK